MIRSYIREIWYNRWIIRFLPAIIYFNFKNLPFRQAIKLPILLYKPKFSETFGRIVIDVPVKFGMIRLGVNGVSIYPNDGIVIDNRGTITFKGRVSIGNHSAIAVGPKGQLVFEDNFRATCGLKLVCYHDIYFEKNVLIGWNSMICDFDFHKLTYLKGGYSKGYGKIKIGHNTWIANGCKIYKNVEIPPYCVVGADTILNQQVKCEPYSLICNSRPIEIKIQGVYRNRDDDVIDDIR